MERKLLGLITTFRCPVRCRMCCFSCGPERHERIEQGHLLSLIDQAREAGFAGVGFSGGEAIILGHDLIRAVRHAHRAGLTVHCVTNAYWAISPAEALLRLAQLKDAGLSVLTLSCDDQHQEHIPVERVKHAFEAALKLGLPVIIETARTYGDKITPEWLKSEFTPPKDTATGVYLKVGTAFNVDQGRHGLKHEELLYDHTGRVSPAEGGESVIIAHPEAVRLDEPDPGEPPPESDDEECGFDTIALETTGQPQVRVAGRTVRLSEGYGIPCPVVLSHPAVAPDGTLLGCCSTVAFGVPELTLGSTRENSLSSLLGEAGDDLILNWLSQQGPTGIAAYLWRAAPEVTWRPSYACLCDLCQDIFTHPPIRQALEARAHELAPAIASIRNLLREH